MVWPSRIDGQLGRLGNETGFDLRKDSRELPTPHGLVERILAGFEARPLSPV